MADIFQINYEQMEQIVAMFKTAGEATATMRSQIQASFDPLVDGAWLGEGSNAFVNTMDSHLFPALERLQEALELASSVSNDVAELIRAAEEAAADVFKGESEGFLDSVGDFFSGAADSIGNFFSGAADAVGDFWSGASEWVHGGLDVLGFIPGFGEIADGINGVIYLAEGRHLEAGISFAAMIPIVGDAGKIGKYGVKVGLEIAEEGGERIVKEIVEEGGERIVKEGAQEGGERVVKNVAEETFEETAQRVPDIISNLPKNPDDLLSQGWKEISHPNAAANGHRTFVDESGLTLRFDKGKPGAGGFKEVDHYHLENPHATGKKGQYFDRDGNPVNDGSGPSHITID